MICKHVNITTSDVAGGAEFFERFFGFECRHRGGRDGNGIAVLCNEDNFVLTLMTGKGDLSYPATFHVGFYVDSPDAVRAKHDELSAGGLVPGQVQHLSRGGDVTFFYCTAPGDFEVEISTPPEDVLH
jgi:catechol 2,3-dioxygenase-like lactoylglutathione lyase family enzyme